MSMAMMQIWVMRVFVAQRRVAVPVCMRLGDWAIVLVVMVIVVGVEMIMLERFMHMIMLVAFRQMQPQAETHQQSCDDKR